MDLAFLLLLPVTSIIAWIFAFVAAGRYQSIYDKVLIALLLCGGFSIYTVDRHLKCSPDDILYAVFDNIQSLSALSIFPLLFIYIRSITIGKQWEKWYLWLFAPAAVLCLAGTVSSILFGWDAVPVLRIDVFNITLESMSCILLGYCIYYILLYHKSIANFYANLKPITYRYLHLFLASMLVLILTIFLLTLFISEIVTLSSSVWICISLWVNLLVWAIAYSGFHITLTQKEMNRMNLLLSESETLSNKLDSVLLDKIKRWVERADAPFCREGLTIADMAADIHTSPRTLSSFINSYYKMNFNRWINDLRIQKAKQLFESDPGIKIGYVSTVCGFSDHAAFSNTFRKIAGCSPQTFRDKLVRQKN